MKGYICMMKIFLSLLVFAVFTVNSANAAKNETQSDLYNGGISAMNETKIQDYEAVKDTLNKYIEAGRAGKSSILHPYVHKDALMFGRTNGELSGGSIEELFVYLDTHPAAKEMKAEITTIDIAEGIAYAKIESNNWNGANFTDMFLLVKDGKDWKILTKTYYTH